MLRLMLIRAKGLVILLVTLASACVEEPPIPPTPTPVEDVVEVVEGGEEASEADAPEVASPPPPADAPRSPEETTDAVIDVTPARPEVDESGPEPQNLSARTISLVKGR